MIIDEETYLKHYGILRRSGRYPWGSGQDAPTRSRDFLGTIDDLKKKGMTDSEIMRGFGMNTTDYRAAKSIARNQKKQADIAEAHRLKEKGLSNISIGQRMGINESSVRSLLAPGQKHKADVLQATSNMLKDQVAKKNYIDIGANVEHHIGVSKTKLATAVSSLKEEGYKVYYVEVEQLGTGKKTTIKVLAKPDTTYSEVYRNRAQIQQIAEHSNNGGLSYQGLRPPTSISSKRIAIRYAEDGGAAQDGVIYVRRNKDDVSLGGSSYAQVRIAVDGTHYIKGMAMYHDDMPDGIDLVVNVNKRNTGNKLDALKPMKRDSNGNIDKENPFGASIKPGGQRGVHNIVNEEGDWERWSKTLSSQVLSKQSPSLAKSQLDMTYDKKRRELEEIQSLTNPVVRRRLLEAFADDADSAAVHLKAAHLPQQRSHVILPINSMRDTEIYAPNYRNGDRVVLIRYPHGGIFEIPELTVNNRHPQAKKALGNAKDAVGINTKVAQRLSGADFDGDTVLVIPNNNRKIKTASPLQGLKDFDPIASYPKYDGMKVMSPRTKQVEMGVVSNLITDMTIRGASSSELARAVRHSMVVIDAEKHGLNWKQSAIDNGIKQLKEKYQGGVREGASTLISRAGAEVRVPVRRPRPAAKGGPIDRETGRKVFEETGETFIDRKGRVQKKTFISKRLAETEDANTLSSGTPIEKVYAVHSNKMKALANEARRSAVNTKGITLSSSAKTAYAKEVKSLNEKLVIALRNAPLERQAQLLANSEVSQKRRDNPEMEPSEIKRIKNQALVKARIRTGAHKQRIDITDNEWAAIQAGAISTNKLNQILNNSDLDRIKTLATPKSSTIMTASKKSRALSMIKSGYTQSEVADALGISLSTLKNSIEG